MGDHRPVTLRIRISMEKNHWLINCKSKRSLVTELQRDWSQLYIKNMNEDEATECIKLIENKLKNAEINAMKKLYG